MALLYLELPSYFNSFQEINNMAGCGCGKSEGDSTVNKKDMLDIAGKIVDLFPEDANSVDARQVMQIVVTLMPNPPAPPAPPK